MNNFFDGFERKEVTLNATGTVDKGNLVEFSNSYTVDVAADGHLFVGVCTGTDGRNASIQLKGYTRVRYSGTAPECGYVKLAADSYSGVKRSENGRYVLVTDVDDNDGSCGIIL